MGCRKKAAQFCLKRIFKIKKTVYKREKNREVKKMNLKGRNFLKLLDFTPEESVAQAMKLIADAKVL